ncbi:uncharacterized protein PG998_007134 [Apiospora kogelbergensis]|uniref:uncharacterized protein n=1 Tax=Apiospora kogelbergensis TaxID=1337665 RepID=UPI0031327970
MPAVIDWSSLLWPGSSTSTSKTLSSKQHLQQATNPGAAVGVNAGASAPPEPDLSRLISQRLAFITGGVPIDPLILGATLVAVLWASYWIFRTLFGRPQTQPQAPLNLIEDVKRPIESIDSTNFDTTALQNEMSRRLNEIEAHNKKVLADQVEAIQKRFQQDLDNKVQAIEARAQLLQQDLDDKVKATEGHAQRFQLELNDKVKASEGHTQRFQQDLNDKVKAIEEHAQKRFQQDLDDKVKAIESHVQKSLGQRLEEIDDDVRRRLKQSVEIFEDGLRTKLNKESFDAIYREVSIRVEALEEGVRIMDGKQLDVEAATIVQRALGQRLNTVEETMRAVEGKTRTTSQRADAFDDSLRVIDSRTKAMSQRLEAVEDNMGNIDAQTTLLSHDVTRGEKAIENVQRQVRTLPDNERMKEFSEIWETKFLEIEAKVEEFEGERTKLLEDIQRGPTLTWSRMDSQEIEPSGPLYTQQEEEHTEDEDEDDYVDPLMSPEHHTFNYNSNMAFMPPTPSPSDRSRSRGSRSSDSFYIKRSTPTPTSASSQSKRKRLEAAGFTDTTFASRQRLFHSRTTSTF